MCCSMRIYLITCTRSVCCPPERVSGHWLSTVREAEIMIRLCRFSGWSEYSMIAQVIRCIDFKVMLYYCMVNMKSENNTHTHTHTQRKNNNSNNNNKVTVIKMCRFGQNLIYTVYINMFISYSGQWFKYQIQVTTYIIWLPVFNTVYVGKIFLGLSLFGRELEMIKFVGLSNQIIDYLFFLSFLMKKFLLGFYVQYYF